MPKGPRQTMGRDLEKPKRLTVRDAVFFVLGGLAVAGGSYALSSGKPDEPAFKPVRANSAPAVSESVPDLKFNTKRKSEKLQSAEAKPLSLEEMQKRVHEAETQERLKTAQAIIDEYCIENPEDMEQIMEVAMDGNVTFKKILQDKDGSWTLSFVQFDDNGSISDHFYLDEEPSCNLPEMPEKSEEDKILELIEENNFLEALEQIDMDRIRQETSSQGVDQRMVNMFIQLIEETKQALRKDMSPEEKRMFACSTSSRTSMAFKGINNKEDIDMYKFSHWFMDAETYASKVFNQFDEEFAASFRQSVGIQSRSGCERFLYESLVNLRNEGGNQQ